MLLEIVKILNNINELTFHAFDEFVESFGMAEWITESIIDSFHVLPFLLFIFILIEFIEYYSSDVIDNVLVKSKKFGPIVGGLFSMFPQCGFSIMASSLYVKRFITRGTIIAIYIATSDEALPVLLSYPDKINLVVPIICIKLVIAIIAGYCVDVIIKTKLRVKPKEEKHKCEEGCCHHDITSNKKFNLLLHPLVHTLHIFVFILIITFILNFFISETYLTNILMNSNNKIFEPVITSIIGLIPNCAVSITLTMMLIKGTISFGGAIAGLCSNSGLGLLILLRKNKVFKDSVLIINLLLIISIISGLLVQLIYH